MEKNHQSRRRFLYNLGVAGLSIPIISANAKCNDELFYYQGNQSSGYDLTYNEDFIENRSTFEKYQFTRITCN